MEPFGDICSICNITFLGSELKKHQFEAHKIGTKMFECKKCEKLYKNKLNLRRHFEEVHSNPAMESSCDQCGNVYGNQFRLKRHIFLMHDPKSFSCETCSEEFTYKKRLEVHIGRKHLKLRTVPCLECPKKFYSDNDMKTHVVQVHSDLKPFKCDECPAAFKRNAGWHTHKKTHMESQDFQCAVCQKKFKHRMSARRCLDVHQNGYTSYTCTYENCTTVLSTLAGFQYHIKAHSPRERVSCTVCTRTLSSNSELRRHTRGVHGNEQKKYACQICGVKTSTNAQLSRHGLIHNGDSFNCSIEGCTRKSNTQYGMNFHMKKKHGQVKHRRPIEDIEKDQEKLLDCTLCDKKVRAGPAPLHTMKMHILSHTKPKQQFQLDCPIDSCQEQICLPFTKLNQYNSCNFPLEYYNHLENEHSISFQEYKLKATFSCYICNELIVLKSDKQKSKTGKSYAKNWGQSLANHLDSAHHIPLTVLGKRWKEYFKREVILERNVAEEVPFIEKMLRSRRCGLVCDFLVADKQVYGWRKTLLKHYCTEHFGAKLLEMESKFFEGRRFPKCKHCGFELSNGDKKLNSKAVHIGVVHNEIIAILTTHFSDRLKEDKSQKQKEEQSRLCSPQSEEDQDEGQPEDKGHRDPPQYTSGWKSI